MFIISNAAKTGKYSMISYIFDIINNRLLWKKSENILSRKFVAVYLNAVLTRPWQTFSPYKHISMPIKKQMEAF